ncbi:SAM-dependent methyltransferase [Pseudonocardia sp. CNS-139]|nr:SAM-dependent methyltransferase [Pseudonocardia sp. CNS-139]
MVVTPESNDEQTARWNGPAGQAWVDLQGVLDEMFRPLEDLLVEGIVAKPGGGVLDVGCGTGSTTLAAARRSGGAGRCVGIDLSGPMIAVARERAERAGVPARFLHADAQEHTFDPAAFDTIMSRFGVMFFDDPVRAFANLRWAAAADAEFRFVAWRSAAENPFMTTAERAAAPFLPERPAPRPDAPGQFAFADRGRIQRVLEASGWAGIDIRPIDVVCTLPEPELERYFTRLGPLAQVLHEVDGPTREQVIDTVRPGFDTYLHGGEVRFTAACWLVRTRAAPHPIP